MTKHEAWEDLYNGNDICLTCKYGYHTDGSADRISFIFKAGDYTEQKFYDKVAALTAGAENWTFSREPKAPKIEVKEWNE